LLNAPNEYFELLGADFSGNVVKSGKTSPSFPLQEERDVAKNLAKDENIIVHLFVVERKDLEKQFHRLIKDLPANAIIWISWYKKSAKIPTDITEDIIREIVLPTGWVDVKVCSVSEVWSGLKIVKRKELR
jgi:hypothetical protein